METKICFRCNKEKSLSEYYKHPKNRDGHLNKCKTCTKGDSKNNEVKKRKDKSFVAKERERHREKYHRLNYREKHKPTYEQKRDTMKRFLEKYPEKKLVHARRVARPPVGFHNHHWSYNIEHAKDVIVLSVAEHNLLHRHIIYDQERMMYRATGGILLDTKEAHVKYFNCIKEESQ